MSIRNLGSFSVLTCLLTVFAVSSAQAETLDTRIGKLEFTQSFADGYPTDEIVSRLYDEMDFQRAVQSYFWAIC